MSLKERIKSDFIGAMKNKEKELKTLLSVILGEIQNEAGRSGKEDDETVLGILKKIEKSLKQTNTTESLIELEYINPYLPKMMTEEEIETIIKGYHNDNGLSTMPDMMKEFNANYKGKADNKVVSSVINKIISGR